MVQNQSAFAGPVRIVALVAVLNQNGPDPVLEELEQNRIVWELRRALICLGLPGSDRGTDQPAREKKWDRDRVERGFDVLAHA